MTDIPYFLLYLSVRTYLYFLFFLYCVHLLFFSSSDQLMNNWATSALKIILNVLFSGHVKWCTFVQYSDRSLPFAYSAWHQEDGYAFLQFCSLEAGSGNGFYCEHLHVKKEYFEQCCYGSDHLVSPDIYSYIYGAESCHFFH